MNACFALLENIVMQMVFLLPKEIAKKGTIALKDNILTRLLSTNALWDISVRQVREQRSFVTLECTQGKQDHLVVLLAVSENTALTICLT